MLGDETRSKRVVRSEELGGAGTIACGVLERPLPPRHAPSDTPSLFTRFSSAMSSHAVGSGVPSGGGTAGRCGPAYDASTPMLDTSAASRSHIGCVTSVAIACSARGSGVETRRAWLV